MDSDQGRPEKLGGPGQRVKEGPRGKVEEEENEEIKTKLCSLVSRKWLERFSSTLICRLP